MRIARLVACAAVVTTLAGLAMTDAVAQSEQEKTPAKHHIVVKRPDPDKATMPEKQDWISQTLGKVLDGIDDLGKPSPADPRR